MPSTSTKLKMWVKATKALNLIPYVKDLTPHFIGKNGKPVSQPMASYILQGKQPFRDRHIKSICNAFFFTPEEYFTSNAEMFNIKNLIKYLREKTGMTQKELAKEIGYTSSQISYINNFSEPENIQIVLDYFNERLDLDLDAIEINKVNINAGYIPNSHLIPPMVKRMEQIVNDQIESGRFKNSKQLCDEFELNYAQYSRIFNSRGTLDVPKNFIIKIAKGIPTLNLRWFLLGEGERYLPQVNQNPIQSLEKSLQTFLQYAKNMPLPKEDA